MPVEKLFPAVYPSLSRECLRSWSRPAVSSLDRGALIEVDMIAVLD